MQFLCICQQPDNFDLFKDHRSTSPGGGAYKLSYSGAWVAQVGYQVRGGEVQKCKKTMLYIYYTIRGQLVNTTKNVQEDKYSKIWKREG